MKAPAFTFPFLFICFVLLSCEKDHSEAEDPRKGPGELAEAFLKPSPYEALELHILYMDGYEPKARAVDSVESFLERYLRKPAGIEVSKRKVGSEGMNGYDVETMNEVIDRNSRGIPGSSQLQAYLLIVDGHYKEDDGGATTLGLAFRAQRMALFGEPVHTHSDEATEPPRWKLEGTVMRHEIGHLLGLVDNGTPMVDDHKDHGNGAHCQNSDCLMYYATETSDIVGNLFGNDIPKLDADCREDLEANGGG